MHSYFATHTLGLIMLSLCLVKSGQLQLTLLPLPVWLCKRGFAGFSVFLLNFYRHITCMRITYMHLFNFVI